METTGYLSVSMIPISIAMIMAIMFQIKKKGFLSFFKDDRDPLSIYNEDSVYCLIFSNNLLAWVIYLVTVVIQALSFWIFLKRSNFDDEKTEWAFPYLCNANNRVCIYDGSRSPFGWFMLVVILIYFLGTDFVNSMLQLRKAAYLLDLRLFISGLAFTLFFLTALAFISSIVYNLALAESDPELIVNAIFLLFINDMDEHCLKLLETLAPSRMGKLY